MCSHRSSIPAYALAMLVLFLSCTGCCQPNVCASLVEPSDTTSSTSHASATSLPCDGGSEAKAAVQDQLPFTLLGMEASRLDEVLGPLKGVTVEKTLDGSGTRKVLWFASYAVVLDDPRRVKFVIAHDGAWELQRKRT